MAADTCLEITESLVSEDDLVVQWLEFEYSN